MARNTYLFFIVSASCVLCGQANIEKTDIIETQVGKSLNWSVGVERFPVQPSGNMTSEDEGCFLNTPVVYLDKDGQPEEHKSKSNIKMLKKCFHQDSGHLSCAFEVKMKLAGWHTCHGTLAIGGPESWIYIKVTEPAAADPWYETMWNQTTLIAIAGCNVAFLIGFTAAQAVKRKYLTKRFNVKRGYRRQILLRSRNLDDPGLGQ